MSKQWEERQTERRGRGIMHERKRRVEGGGKGEGARDASLPTCLSIIGAAEQERARRLGEKGASAKGASGREEPRMWSTGGAAVREVASSSEACRREDQRVLALAHGEELHFVADHSFERSEA